MFIDNKYYRWYNAIIANASTRVYQDLDYTESHHIIPKSLGGSNNTSNIIKLTAREHFICHWLLTKFTMNSDKQKMSYALWMMINLENSNQLRYKVTSKIYESIKKKLAVVFSEQHAGKKLTEEHKQKISQTRKRLIDAGDLKVNENKDKYKGISEKRKGKKLSEETKQKIGLAHKGKEISQEQRQLLSLKNKGKGWAEDTKQKLSNTLKEQYASGERIPIKGMLGKKMSDASKEKISQALKGKPKPPRSEEYKKAQSERVKKWWEARKINNVQS